MSINELKSTIKNTVQSTVETLKDEKAREQLKAQFREAVDSLKDEETREEIKGFVLGQIAKGNLKLRDILESKKIENELETRLGARGRHLSEAYGQYVAPGLLKVNATVESWVGSPQDLRATTTAETINVAGAKETAVEKNLAEPATE